MLNRMIGAALFRTSTYEEIEADATAIGQAFMVVLLVTVCGIVGGILNEVLSPPTAEVQTAAGELVTGELVSGEAVVGGTGAVEALNSETMGMETVEGTVVAVETLTVVGIVLAIVGGLFFGVVRWAMWVTLMLMIGGGLLRTAATQTSWSELGRMMGFAYTPGILSLLTFIPSFGGLFWFIGFVWTLVGVVVAVRYALDYESVGRAIAVVLISGILGFIPWIIIKVIEWIII